MPRRLVLAAFLLGACGQPLRRTYPEPTAEQLLDHVRGVRERISSLRADTTSDAWIGESRAKGTVLLMATWGGRLRVQSIGPHNAMVSDFASDGETICVLDARADCGDCGPATPENVGQILKLEMPPDDVVAALFGASPVLAGARAQARWDEREGREVLDLVAGGLHQHLELDGDQRRWDVLDSKLRDAAGKTLWRIQHGKFHEVTTSGGQPVRMPGISKLTGPRGDVEIRWREQEVGLELPVEKFRLELPAGLRPCR